MKPVEVPCIEAKQHGRTIYVCSMAAKDLANLYNLKVIAVDSWSPQHQEGYQRMPVETRGRKFARYIASKEISPTTILMYLRDPENGIEFKNGKLTIPIPEKIEKPLLYLVDGQHRTLGLAKGYEMGLFDNQLQFEIPIAILVRDDHVNPLIEEAKQFRTINMEQKRVRTDLANQLLLNIRSELKEEIGQTTLLDYGTRKELTPFATTITNILSEDSDSPWFEKIVRPSTTRAASGLPSQGQFEDSLLDGYVGDSIIGYGVSAGYNVGELVTVLKNYWKAIFELMPQAIQEPEKYYVTKTVGIHALNALIPSIFHIKRLNKVPSKDDFKKVLSGMDSFSEAFWSAGGEVGAYGGGKSAFKNLTVDLHKQLLG